MDPADLVSIGAGVVTNLATQIVTAIPGWALHRLRGSKEGSALLAVVAGSVCQAFTDASRDGAADAEWLGALAGEWEPAFTPAVSAQLIAALRGGHDLAGFRAAARDALEASGADLASLDRAIDVSEFLHVLPRRLFDGMRAAALAPDSAVRDLVGALLLQDTVSVVAGALHEASPREYRADLADLLHQIERRAVLENLPRFAPPGSSITTLTVAMRVRRGVRTGDGGRDSAPDVYALPGDLTPGEEPAVDWQQIAEREDRVVVLGDPGMGKSWLIRWETARLARVAYTSLESGARAEEIEIPVPIRCDELAASVASDLAQSVCSFLFARYGVPQRSQRLLAAQVADGRLVLLLDALDEIPDRAARRHLDELLAGWMAGDDARFRMASRIAGYTGVPAPEATTALYEIQPFTESEVAALIDGWGLPPALVARLHEHVSSTTMAGVARIPLLTALLCATAVGDEELPRTTAGVYERVLRRFLAQENRWPQSPEPEATEIDQLIGILAPLAFHFATRADGWTDQMPATQVMTVMRALGPAYTELGRDAATLLRDLSVQAGVLVPAASQGHGHNPPYLFLHRTMAEYLVAWHLATLPRAEWLAVVTDRMWFDPHWQPVISMLGATFAQQQRPAESAFLVSYLLDQAVDPFDQGLLHAARVAAELADHRVLPSQVASRLADRLVALIDIDWDWQPVGNFLRHHLSRLPWEVTQALLRRTDNGARGRWLTTEILATSRDPRVTTRLVSLLDDDQGPVPDVFEAFRNQDADCYVDEMLRRFEDPEQRHLASPTLQSYSASPRVLAAMLRHVADPDPIVRQEVFHVLAGRHDDEVIAAWRAAITDDDDSFRHLAVAGLAGADIPDRTAILTGLIDDADPVVVLTAAGKVLDDDSIPVEEVVALARHSNPDVRSCVAKALSDRHELAQATAALIDLTADSESYVRFRAAEALASYRSQDAATALIGLLDDDEEIAAKAAESLRAHDRPDVAGLVLDWLGPDPEPAQFAVAAIVLQGSSAPAASETLTAALGSADAQIRLAAAQALTGSDDGQVRSALFQRLADPSPLVREAVLRALAPARDPHVVAAIAVALADEAPDVRAAAVTALPLSDTHPELVIPVLSLLADAARIVRDAVIQQVKKTTMPSVLRWICESAPDIGDLLAISGTAIKELADRVFRALSADEQATVVRRLATAGAQPALTVSHPASDTAGPNWSAPGIGKYVSPDIVSDEFLDEIIVILLQGSNMFGSRVYSYVELPGRRLGRMFGAMRSGRNFRPSEYGQGLCIVSLLTVTSRM